MWTAKTLCFPRNSSLLMEGVVVQFSTRPSMIDATGYLTIQMTDTTVFPLHKAGNNKHSLSGETTPVCLSTTPSSLSFFLCVRRQGLSVHVIDRKWVWLAVQECVWVLVCVHNLPRFWTVTSSTSGWHLYCSPSLTGRILTVAGRPEADADGLTNWLISPTNIGHHEKAYVVYATPYRDLQHKAKSHPRRAALCR